ncbi:uncharacterized protein SPSK_03671 [Sporothrix schenckii 1099-18]|uniref:Uncharacterized protein n=1 Tax=Sporothrix schenckii 1099-18 TaxID=1397361 RepID=A0A0F2LZ61_SPOSC|nr:uncharacterized protein SPSK_03671 [Sporothrix schenckii 1099-18]KJR82748.1 hypothetical protein SPSK_03671 [Sporothrix schenckii 1099-18]
MTSEEKEDKNTGWKRTLIHSQKRMRRLPARCRAARHERAGNARRTDDDEEEKKTGEEATKGKYACTDYMVPAEHVLRITEASYKAGKRGRAKRTRRSDAKGCVHLRPSRKSDGVFVRTQSQPELCLTVAPAFARHVAECVMHAQCAVRSALSIFRAE